MEELQPHAEGLNSFARGLRSGARFLQQKNKATPYGNNVALVCLHISKLVPIYIYIFLCYLESRFRGDSEMP